MLSARAIYLAGPIENCTEEEMNEWRNDATEMLNPIKCFNPCKRHFSFAGKNLAEVSKEVVALDKAEIAASDGLLVWYNPPAKGSKMTGTTMEIIHAFERGKLVVVVSDSIEISAWVHYHCHRVFPNLKMATEFIKDFYS